MSKALVVVGQQQRLLDDHDRGLAAEVLVDRLAVDRDLAVALLQEHARHRGLAAAGAVVPIADHFAAPWSSSALGCWAVCGCVGTAVHLELLDHRVAERALGQHALDGLLERAARVLGLHVLEGRGVDAARIARMAVVDLVAGLVAGDADLVGVDDDDEVAGIDVRRVNGLVLAAQTECHFAGNTSEHLVGGVNHKPLVLHFGRFGAEGFHEGLAEKGAPRNGNAPRNGCSDVPAAFGAACAGGLSGQIGTACVGQGPACRPPRRQRESPRVYIGAAVNRLLAAASGERGLEKSP